MAKADAFTPQQDAAGFTRSFGSDAMLDEEYSNSMQAGTHQRKKKMLLIGTMVLLACVGAAGALVVMTKKSSTSSTKSSGSTSNTTSNATSTNFAVDNNNLASSTTGNSETAENAKVYTDPTAETYSLSTFAIGDWGATTYSKNGSCCNRRKGVFNAYDRHAELGVNHLMAIESAKSKPQAVLGHGDNFYWTGINSQKDQSDRFTFTFEERHGDPAFNTVPWVNVMGNHDYGGGSYICMDGTGNFVKCNSAKELTDSLELKFRLQADYKSPNNNRWILKDHYYKYTIKQGDVSMDIFNLDMNDADVHGTNEICCQCYSYSEGGEKACSTATRGDKFCAGGDTGMYDACAAKLKEWGDEAFTELQKDVAASTATWKVVNSHYSPYGHMGETKGKKWMDALKQIKGLQLWIYGHTHGEKHDWASFNTHFIENGAGGGIQSESASGIPDYAKDSVANVWVAPGLGDDGGNTYGFFKLEASAAWMKASFITFGDGWSLTKSDDGYQNAAKGSTKVGHCWYIPSDGTKGKPCSS